MTIEVFISYLKDGFGSRFHASELRNFGFWTLGLNLKSDQTSTNSFDCFPIVSDWKQWRRFALEGGYTTCFWPHRISELKKWVACQIVGSRLKLELQQRHRSVSNLWLSVTGALASTFDAVRISATGCYLKAEKSAANQVFWGASIWRKAEGFLGSFAVPALLYWV
jgi:hypothetical protein